MVISHIDVFFNDINIAYISSTAYTNLIASMLWIWFLHKLKFTANRINLKWYFFYGRTVLYEKINTKTYFLK